MKISMLTVFVSRQCKKFLTKQSYELNYILQENLPIIIIMHGIKWKINYNHVLSEIKYIIVWCWILIAN